MNKNGFTIIETLIVLAIAGFILLIIFSAIPALQRNDRNTRRKHDAAYIAVERLNYDQDNGTTLIYGEDTCPGTGTFLIFCTYLDAGLSYYDPSEITVIDNGTSPPTSLPPLTIDTIVSESYLVCDSTDTGATTVGATELDAVTLFQIETSNGPANYCIEQGLVSPN